MITHINTQDETTYELSDKIKLRIKQIAKDKFIIERFFEIENKTGHLWWRKKTFYSAWHHVDLFLDRQNQFINSYRRSTRYKEMTLFKTHTEAVNFIMDYIKYPIIH